MTDNDKALVERLRGKAEWLDPEIDMIEEWEASDAADRIEAQAAEIEYWKAEARSVRKELKSEQKSTDNAMDNYDAGVRRIEAQAAEIERLREALRIAAIRLAHLGGQIEASFAISGTLRAERAMIARHMSDEALAALAGKAEQ